MTKCKKAQRKRENETSEMKVIYDDKQFAFTQKPNNDAISNEQSIIPAEEVQSRQKKRQLEDEVPISNQQRQRVASMIRVMGTRSQAAACRTKLSPIHSNNKAMTIYRVPDTDEDDSKEESTSASIYSHETDKDTNSEVSATIPLPQTNELKKRRPLVKRIRDHSSPLIIIDTTTNQLDTSPFVNHTLTTIYSSNIRCSTIIKNDHRKNPYNNQRKCQNEIIERLSQLPPPKIPRLSFKSKDAAKAYMEEKLNIMQAIKIDKTNVNIFKREIQNRACLSVHQRDMDNASNQYEFKKARNSLYNAIVRHKGILYSSLYDKILPFNQFKVGSLRYSIA